MKTPRRLKKKLKSAIIAENKATNSKKIRIDKVGEVHRLSNSVRRKFIAVGNKCVLKYTDLS